MGEYHGDIAGEIVPYVRIGRERWTPRAMRYLGSRDRLRVELALAIRGQDGPGPGPLVVTLHFYRWRQGSDLDNSIKAFLDSGNGVLWTDDRVIEEIHAYRYRTAKGADRVTFGVRPVDNSSGES